ncbi:glycoside hydrolase family 140 protein [Chitinophaga horti]|uniref:Glycoside hydrolase family 140 protein n=1 Tax=Chitinophaga horti TaxID=2920382 RepID=A0ABY6JB74_9BACT|nr:glycoside hydrolase family 140 protein [Chitinophaga horti]UYQ95546.1 glycoside hydrolase family 140 protein [Chitinophaga horti]
MKVLLTGWLIVWACLANGQSLPAIKVSPNKRFFCTADGKPFFWLGDTGWLLFVKCNREDALQYLDGRKAQGFNVIQVMVLHELKSAKNVYGDSALVNGDVSKPYVKDGYDYWDHVEFIVDEAAKRGIYMALVPVWGSNVKGGHVSVSQAEAYATFLATRFKGKSNVVWMNGGDVRGSEGLAVWQKIGTTLKKHDPQHLVTYHPRGRYSSSDWFHNAAWLDFNIFQSGHRTYAQDTSKNDLHFYGEDNWRYVQADYNRRPVKPVFDGEPSYENIPHGLHDSLEVRWNAADLRRYAYWSVFAGGAGFTYGENAVMQFHHQGDAGANYGVTTDWKTAIGSPGAQQMQYLKKLLEQRPYFDRKPAQEILPTNTGRRYDYLLATKAKDYALVYTFTGQAFDVDLSKLGFNVGKAAWFKPATGETTSFVMPALKGVTKFEPPVSKEDWVLVLER